MEDKKSHAKKSKTIQTEPLLPPGEHPEPHLSHINSLEGGSFLHSYETLKRFLETLNIDLEDISKLASEHGDEPETVIQSLQILFNAETTRCAWIKWATLDHLVEKWLQWPFLARADLNAQSKCCTARVKPVQRSILLKSPAGLVKAYGTRGFVKGVEHTLAKSVHYFVYAMLTYRLVEWRKTGNLEFTEFKNLFDNSSQKGIDTLIHVLSDPRLGADWLKVILSTPALIGLALGLSGMCGSREISGHELQTITDQVKNRLKKPGNFCRDTLQEYLPLFSQLCSLSRKLQKLERAIRWDGRLSSKERLQMFNLIHRVAREGNQMTQIHAMECLAKIAHGIGFKDLPKLQQAGYSKEDILSILYTKAIALQDLTALTEAKSPLEPPLRWWQIPNQFSQHIAPIPRRVYTNYLLWWLGISTSFIKQKLPFSTLKAAKLGLEVYFLMEIVKSVVTAINCPDKQGFEISKGEFANWASDYTAECFNTRLSLFRSVDPNESFEELMAEIDKYHLTDLEELILRSLNASEFKKLLQSVIQKAPGIETIEAYDNRFGAFQIGTFYGLSQIKKLFFHVDGITTLILSNGAFDGLDGLQTLDLSSNRLTILSNATFRGLVQLQTLNLRYNNLVYLSPNIFKELICLQYLDLGHNQLTILPNGIFDHLLELQALYLANNKLKMLPAGIFGQLKNLQGIALDDNQLTTLPDHLFDGLTRLRVLYLNANPLTTFPLCVSQILNQLIGLGLDSSIITSDMFDNFTRLDRLALSGFTTVPIEITKLNQLNYLYLDNNPFTSLPKGIFANFSRLRVLFLQYNQLITLPVDIFQGLNQLEQLSIAANQLTYLPAGIFNPLNRLQRINLAINQLTTLPAGIFSGLNQLKELALSVNQLTTLPIGIFNHLRQLESVELGYNHLNDMAIFNLTQSFPYQLKTLGIDRNFISEQSLAALVKVLPCTNLRGFKVIPSLLPINDTSLLQKAQSELLEKVCSDRLCHANLPPAASCSIDTATDSPALLRNSLWMSDWSYGSTYFPSYSSVFSSNTTPLALPSASSSTQNDSKMAASSAALIGSVGLGILLYKNCTLLQSVVNTGWGFVKQCFYGKKEAQQQVAPAESEESSAHATNLGTQTKRSSVCSVFATFFFKPKTDVTPQMDSNPSVRHSLHV